MADSNGLRSKRYFNWNSISLADKFHVHKMESTRVTIRTQLGQTNYKITNMNSNQRVYIHSVPTISSSLIQHQHISCPKRSNSLTHSYPEPIPKATINPTQIPSDQTMSDSCAYPSPLPANNQQSDIVPTISTTTSARPQSSGTRCTKWECCECEQVFQTSKPICTKCGHRRCMSCVLIYLGYD